MPTESPRECGSCGICCKIPQIQTMEKPYGKWCTHCDVGRGCRIYADRPDVCRGFECLWLSSPTMPDAFRPDRCGVLLSPRSSAKHGRTVLAMVEAGQFDRIKKPKFLKVLEYVRAAGFRIFVSDGRRSYHVERDGRLTPDTIEAALE
ncbi:MAG: hypothetical protein AAFX81_21415 [Pseudomonadota bacterium]